jgi:hypothetical protein
MKSTQAGLVAAVAVAFLTIGCGKQEHQKLASESGTLERDVMERPVATTASLIDTAPRADGGTRDEALPATADSLPPDVVASASSLVADRGQVVEITAQGSMDITEVILSDGLHKVPLAYDMEAKAWRGVYRVPLRTKADRVGLAVTATNGHGRWERVWVFIEVGKPGVVGEEKTSVGGEEKTGTETQGITEPAQGTGEQGAEPAKDAQPTETGAGNGNG